MLCLCLVVVNCTFSIMGPILPQGESPTFYEVLHMQHA
jgi:hypothetical protein